MLISNNTILLLDLIIIIIIKYCNNIKIDDNFKKLIKSNKKFDYIPINNTKSNKLINFLLEQLNIIYKSKDFKILKSNIKSTNKTYPIQNLKNWLSTIYIELNSLKYEGLFSNHFKINTEIKNLDLTKGYQTYINHIINLKKNKIKYDIKESNNKNISKIFNLLFYPFKNTKIGGGPKDKSVSSSQAGRNVKLLTGKSRITAENFVKAIQDAIKRRSLKESQSRNISSSRNITPLWQRLKRIVFDSRQKKNLLLKMINSENSPEIKGDKRLLTLLSLREKDLDDKEAFVSYWKNIFDRNIEKDDLLKIIRIFRINGYASFKTAFVKEMDYIKGTYPENIYFVYLALLLNMWTSQGNEWVYELLIQNKEPSPNFRIFEQKFIFLYEKYLKPYMQNIFVPKLQSQGYNLMISECNFNEIIVEERREVNIGHKYMCLLSLLARYVCFDNNYFTTIHKDKDEDKDKYIDIYCGTEESTIDILFVNKSDRKPPKIAVSASSDLETAFNFARTDDEGFRRLFVYRIKDGNGLFSCIPIEFFSEHLYEKEVLLIPQSPFTLRSEDIQTITKSQTLQLVNPEKQIQNEYAGVLEKKTKNSQDLMELGIDPLKISFVGFESSSLSFPKTLMLFRVKQKFKNKLSEKKLELNKTDLDEFDLDLTDLDEFDLDLTELDLTGL